MTFRDQLRITFRLGSAVLVAGGIVFAARYGAQSVGYDRTGEVLFYIAIGVTAIAALALIAGLVGRSAHRWLWFNVISRSTRQVFGRTMAQRLLASPASRVLHLWLHIDPEGKDRDGRN